MYLVAYSIYTALMCVAPEVLFVNFFFNTLVAYLVAKQLKKIKQLRPVTSFSSLPCQAFIVMESGNTKRSS